MVNLWTVGYFKSRRGPWLFAAHLEAYSKTEKKTQKQIQGYLILFIYFLFSTIKGYVKPQVLLQALEPIISVRLPLWTTHTDTEDQQTTVYDKNLRPLGSKKYNNKCLDLNL